MKARWTIGPGYHDDRCRAVRPVERGPYGMPRTNDTAQGRDRPFLSRRSPGVTVGGGSPSRSSNRGQTPGYVTVQPMCREPCPRQTATHGRPISRKCRPSSHSISPLPPARTPRGFVQNPNLRSRVASRGRPSSAGPSPPATVPCAFWRATMPPRLDWAAGASIASHPRPARRPLAPLARQARDSAQ